MQKRFLKGKEHENIWQVQEAKAKFSQVVENANKKGHQTITKNGKPIAVVLSQEEFEKITEPKTSLLEFFRSAPYPELELDITRSRDLPREIDL